MRYISRSSHQTFSECRRKGYWGFLYKDGLSGAQTEWPLIMGLTVHKGMEQLFTSKDIQDAVAAMAVEWIGMVDGEDDSFETLQRWAICEGLLRGWHRVRFASFMERYEVISIEKEVKTLLAPNVMLLGRADLVARDKRDGFVYVFNWKTTGNMKEWDLKWEDDIQAMTEALLTQEDLGIQVQGCIFEGLYKGSQYKGVSTSPLVTAYRMEKGDAVTWSYPSGDRPADKEKQASWVKVPVWEAFPGGVEAWINFLPEDVVAEQFIRGNPVMKNDHGVQEWLKQVVREETDIEYMLGEEIAEDDRLAFFKQNLGYRCKWCPFRSACRYQMTVLEMFEGGLLKKREAHHGVPNA